MLLQTRLRNLSDHSAASFLISMKSNDANMLKERAQIPTVFSSPCRASRRSGRSHRAPKKHEITDCRLSFCCFVLASRHQETGSDVPGHIKLHSGSSREKNSLHQQWHRHPQSGQLAFLSDLIQPYYLTPRLVKRRF